MIWGWGNRSACLAVAHVNKKRRVGNGHQELERLERRADNWNQGAAGEESTAQVIAKRCPSAVALHDRQMPGSPANIDHIILVASGIWVIDSKRPKGRIKVQGASDRTQKLLIDGNDRTELVHKLTRQVNAVKAAALRIAAEVPVTGAFCFHLQADSAIERLKAEDNGLPMFHTWTINGYPLFYPTQMCKRLNAPGTLTSARADELALMLVDLFPAAGNKPATSTSDGPPSSLRDTAMASTRTPDGRVTKAAFKAAKQAEQLVAWEGQRSSIEEVLGAPIPTLLDERLASDQAIWCHHALWHSRVYLECVHDRVGQIVPWSEAGTIVAGLHAGRPSAPQWKALNAFLIRLHDTGLIRCTQEGDRLTGFAVVSDLRSS